MLERPFAHCYETGGMRRVHLRGHENILKRLLIHVAGYNLSLVLRATIGNGTPRGAAELATLFLAALILLRNACSDLTIVFMPRFGYEERLRVSDRLRRDFSATFKRQDF